MTATLACPSCGHELPVDERLSTWCDACSWNLEPQTPPVTSRLMRAYRDAGRRLGRSLVRELREVEALEPRMTPALAAAYAVAGLVYAGVLAMAVGAVALLVLGLPNPFAVVGAILLGGLAVLMRPRLPEMPEGRELTAAEAPSLHALIGEVAETLEAEPPARVVIDHTFNAAWATVGLRRERVLVLGLPLLTALEPGERVAVIAHEIGHDRNGDVRRGAFIGGAIGGLVALLQALAPDWREPDDTEWGWAGPLADAVLWVLSRPVAWLTFLEYLLLMRDSQRAEFLADDLGARVAGTRAALSMEEKLMLAPLWEAVLRGAAVRRDGTDVFGRLREELESMPERERERRRRVARLEHTRLELTHPPTAARIELLEARPHRPVAVALSPWQSEGIDEELRPLRPQMAVLAIDEAAGLLYTG